MWHLLTSVRIKNSRFFLEKSVANNFWKNSAITMVAAIAIDYYIATKLASNNDDVWEWFAILMIVPLVFVIKAALIRIVLWKVFLKKDMVAAYEEMFIQASWAKPSTDYQDAEDYLIDVVDDGKNNLAMRLEAAKMYGYLRSLYETQQVVGALQMSSAIKAAMISYEKNYKEVECQN
jgi:hypothetical protein